MVCKDPSSSALESSGTAWPTQECVSIGTCECGKRVACLKGGRGKHRGTRHVQRWAEQVRGALAWQGLLWKALGKTGLRDSNQLYGHGRVSSYDLKALYLQNA